MKTPDRTDALSCVLSGLRRGNVQAAACRRIAAVCQEVRYAEHVVRLHSFALSRKPAAPARATARARIAKHRHSFYEAVLILSGTAKEVQEPHRMLIPGTLQLNPPGVPHGWQARQTNFERLGIHFSLEPDVPLRAIERWPVCPEAFDELRAILEETRDPTPGSADRIRARLLLLLARFLALLEWPTTAKAAVDIPDASIALRVDRFLDENLDHRLTLSDIAEVVHMSVPTLTRRYRKETGQSVTAHLVELRMRKATEFLRTTGLSVKAIATRVGYAEPTYFCRSFRSLHNCTPLQYRKHASTNHRRDRKSLMW